MKKGLVGNIGRYCLHDGPGIRTTVFFKGCPLHCPWCHNPELASPFPVISFRSEFCLACGDCLQVCPEQAIRMENEERIDRTCCSGCGQCADICPTLALTLVGREYTVDQLVEILLRDRLYYESSGGGITLSGGEPILQKGFVGLLLRRLKQEGIHTVLETCGMFSWDTFAAGCLANLDLILFDVKLADPLLHEELTGQSNGLILANLVRLLSVRPDDVIVRIPLIPRYTATEDNISRLAALFRTLGVRRYSLLPYHPFGITKARRIGVAIDAALPGESMRSSVVLEWRRFFSGMEFVKFVGQEARQGASEGFT